MKDSVYTKIIKGELPSHKVYEDEHSIAILSIDPLVPGHTLVIPKKQISFVWDMNEDDYIKTNLAVMKVGKRINSILKPYRLNILVEGLEIEHVHYHLIPTDDKGIGVAMKKRSEMEENVNASSKNLEAIAKKLFF